LGQEIDYSTWNSDKLEEYLSNPAGSVEGLLVQLDTFIDGTQEYRDLFETILEEYDQKYERFNSLEEGEEKEQLRVEVQELGTRNRNVALNYRYYALSGLSLRRFVLGRMYVELKTRYFFDRDDPEFQRFSNLYEEFLARFESGIVPRLVEADI
jgi:hypothetical protein